MSSYAIKGLIVHAYRSALLYLVWYNYYFIVDNASNLWVDMTL